MSFATGLRLLRCHPYPLSATLTAPPRRLLAKRLSELRFLSAVGGHQPRRFFAVQASSRRREEETEENGSVVAVRDGGGNGGDGGEGRIVVTELHKEATEAYMAYAMSVLLGRALPDVRDGLKPVHRRILFAFINNAASVIDLYAMHELGLSSRKPHKKCARVVGEVLGKFHPHGDNAVYDSLVRMAQDFSLRSPLIRGHGNFGSIDADPPAAMRYTECRLEALAEAMLLADLDLDTVDFVPNFDNSQKEPSLLPARIPNLLLNGASGIAVGMATNIPPHNLGELVEALSVLIHNPEATLQELLEYMPGPDFPTGGIIMGNIGTWADPCHAPPTVPGRMCWVLSGSAYDELWFSHDPCWDLLELWLCPRIWQGVGSPGSNRLNMKTTDIENFRNHAPVCQSRHGTVRSYIPYQTNKASLVEKIAELVENKLKRGSDPSIVLNNLYRLTALQSTFSCNMVGKLQAKKCMAYDDVANETSAMLILPWRPGQVELSALGACHEFQSAGRHEMANQSDQYHQKILNGQPKQMGLKELLQAFLDFRCSVVERRAKFKLSQAQDRYHIVEGIITGLDNLDKVIDIIRKASNHVLAATNLRNEFNFSDKQAEAILDISLRRLTSLEKNKFVDEGKSLSEQISKLEKLLSSKRLVLELIEEEANEIKNKFFTPRRSMLEDTDDGQLEDIDVIPNEEMLLALSEKGYLKRMRPDTFNLQNRGTIGKSVGKLRVNDTMSDFLVCRTHDHVLYFSDKGTVYSARAYRIPECSRAAAGTPLVQILALSDGERITSIIPVSEFEKDQYLIMLTMKGYIKKVSLNYFSSIRSTGIIAIQLVPGDELKWVRRCTNDDFVAMASHNGMVILSPCENIRALGRNTRGGVAMRLKQGDKMASMDLIPASLGNKLEKGSRSFGGPWLLFISESGFGKRVPLGRFRMSPLNRVGLKGYKFALEDRLAAVFVVGFSVGEDGESDEQVVLVSQSGTVNRIKVRDISIQSRYARGVILMRLEHAGKIQSASLISAAEETEPEEILEVAA
ncbi:hypothetical protein BUALT_Bualt01G0148400 [Buddleja alternifolia]|uniref:DNA topoisomerase (ATP-hydrolyzing) n=1 Tax=Buddleja alternifolia TaxID=168488 RepID=A0AAV6YHN4_9LAMI|nr:hypothetical protein BUALT_Bualt01G0148400 [Buddleja alternifolia]